MATTTSAIEAARKGQTHTPGGRYAFVGDMASGVLGTGGHGVVLLARQVTSGEMVAVKVLSADSRKLPLSTIATEITHPTDSLRNQMHAH